MFGWNSKAAEHGLGSTGLTTVNPFSQPDRNARQCDRLRYIAGSAAAGHVPADAPRPC